MLIDVFCTRYEDVPLWGDLDEAKKRFLVQASRMILEQLIPTDYGAAPHKSRDLLLTAALKQVFMELGQNDPEGTVTNPGHVTKNFLQARPHELQDEDVFLKERLSLVELVFRYGERQVEAENGQLPEKLKQVRIQEKKARASGDLVQRLAVKAGIDEAAIVARNKNVNEFFSSNVTELNVRMNRAGLRLTYHGGYLQLTGDELIEERIKQPFWSLIEDPLWANVEMDMLEALDTNDKGGRDPSLYASKALESAVKIVSNEKGWTTGKEKGAANFVENLKKNGYLAQWEEDDLKEFFRKVRNPHGHGPGGEPMPQFNQHQNEWAIETCMSWVKSLITRFEP